MSALTALGSVLMAVLTTASPSPLALPERPPDWHVVEADSRDMRLALPPWMGVADTAGAIFANEPPPADGGGWLQVLAVGPGSACPQPRPGDTLEGWVETFWFAGRPEVGPRHARKRTLPAGPAVEVRATVAAGTPEEWAVIAYAIEGPSGVGLLVLDGPVAAVAAREPELLLIARLLELPPDGAPACAIPEGVATPVPTTFPG
jgi:hypothetical protein